MPNPLPTPGPTADICYGAYLRCVNAARARRANCRYSASFCDWILKGDMAICGGVWARCQAAQAINKAIQIGNEILATPVAGTPYTVGQVIVIAGTAYIIIQLLPVLVLAVA